MAILLTVTPAQLGIEITDAYYRIEDIQIRRESSVSPKFTAYISIAGYPKDPTDTVLQRIDSQSFEVDLDTLNQQVPAGTLNFMAQCYTWLAKQDVFMCGVCG